MTTATLGTYTTPSKAWNVGLWIPQVLLAAAFGMAGFMKLTTPIDQLATMMPWIDGTGELLVRFIGLSELAGAIGLVLPAATRIQPRLTPLAAAGLVTIMVLASALHVTRGELSALPVNFVLGGLAALVAWGRAVKAPVAPRG